MPFLTKQKLNLAQKLSTQIHGFLEPGEGELLFNLAQNCPPQTVIVEIGSWQGKSTVFLGLGSQTGKQNKVYAIDPHTGSPEHQKEFISISTLQNFKRNIQKANLKDLVTPLVKTSAQAAPSFRKKIGLLFIDGDHSYSMAKKDFKLWFPKLVNEGIIIFHDSTTHPGVKKMVNQSFFFSSQIKNIAFQNSLLYGQKVSQNTFFDRLKNFYLFLIHSICFILTTSSFRPPLSVIKIGKKIIRLLQF
jgi:MMP 1-O-methyltransferase